MPEAIAARLIGSLFVERGLVSESQIRVALEIQRETGAQLGQILVEKFGVSRKELTRVVADQWREMNGGDPGSGPDAASGETWRPLGEIFVTRGFVSDDELDAALSRQRKTGERLGEALVALGVISKFELAGALGEQMATLQAAEDDESDEPQATVFSLHQPGPAAAVTEFGAIADAEPGADTDVEHVPTEGDLAALLFERATETRDEVEAPAEEHVEVESYAFVEPSIEVDADVHEPAVEHAAEPEVPVRIEQPEALVEPEPPEPVVELTEPEPPEPVVEVTEPEPVVSEIEAVEPEEFVPEPVVDDVEPEFVPAVDVEVDLWEPELVVGPEPALDRFVAYVSTPKGYRLVAIDIDIDLPTAGQTLDVVEMGELVVARVGRSPLPLDTRLCVYLEQSIASAALPV